MNVAVVILAGGEGRRIGGNKPLRLLGGKRLIDRAEAHARQWSSIVAVAVRDPAQVVPTKLSCIADAEGIEGPLAGLVAALQFAQAAGCEGVLTIPADMPFLPADLAGRLMAEIGRTDAAVASSGGQVHPVCGLWRLSVLDRLSDYLASGQRSLKGLVSASGCRQVDWPNQPSDPFFNINSADDLIRAERLLAG